MSWPKKKTKKFISFPTDFVWGSATASHQTEGNTQNDWSVWEKANATRLAKEALENFTTEQIKKFPEAQNPANYLSLLASDHYQRFDQDFSLMQDLNLKAYRFSLEWSRLMPAENKFSVKAARHYQEVIKSLKEKGIEPWITLCHWTLPVWLVEKGGLECPQFVEYFSRYVDFVLRHLGEHCSCWLVFNEPQVVLSKGFLGQGDWPNQKNNPLAFWKALGNLKRAHQKALFLIHQKYPQSLVATTHHLAYWESTPGDSVLARLLTRFWRYWSNDFFIRSFPGDFIALQYYRRFTVSQKGIQRKIVFPEGSDLGWEIYPKGIYYLLMGLKKYQKPIYVTENGLADATDQKRASFIKDHLYWINRAMQKGAPVKGYFYWSFLDNFEWDKGFWPRFGLVAVDYQTQKRTIRPSALVYQEIIQKNGFNV